MLGNGRGIQKGNLLSRNRRALCYPSPQRKYITKIGQIPCLPQYFKDTVFKKSLLKHSLLFKHRFIKKLELGGLKSLCHLHAYSVVCRRYLIMAPEYLANILCMLLTFPLPQVSLVNSSNNWSMNESGLLLPS